MIKITRQLEGGFGTAFAAFGSDIVDPPAPAPGATPPAGTPPPTPPPATPDPAQVEKDTALFNTLSEKPEATLTEEEKKQLNELKQKYDLQLVGEDGKPLTPEQVKAMEDRDKQLAAIKAKPEAQRTLAEIKFLQDNEEKPLSVYEEVEKLAGYKVDVDYGNVDPLSAEGIIKREEAIIKQAQINFEENLKQEYPIAYQMFLHVQAGGKPEDFLQTNTEDFSAITLVKEDKATQETVYRKALALKGIDKEQIDLLVQAAKDKGKLYDMSSNELIALQKNQAKEEKERAAAVAAKQQQEAALVTSFNSNLNSLLEKGITGVTVPKAERKEFSDFVTSQIFIRDGVLFYARAIDPAKDLEEELAAQYFKFKKGNLSGLVNRTAGTIIAQEKKSAIRKTLVPRTAGNPPPVQKVPMSQV